MSPKFPNIVQLLCSMKNKDNLVEILPISLSFFFLLFMVR